METAVSQMADGTLSGLFAWYVRAHVKRCHKCGPAYRALLSLREGLKRAGQESVATSILGEERWRRIEEACSHDHDD
jgi:hypothetical protein